MRNLRFTLELGPDADYLTCEAFGFYKHPVPTSTTRHLVVDLSQIKKSPLHRPKQGLPAISFAVAAAPAAMQDQKTEERLALDRGDTNSGEQDQQQQQPAENAENEKPADQAAEGQEQGPANLEPQAGQNQRMRLADLLPLPLPIKTTHEKLRKDTELLKLHSSTFACHRSSSNVAPVNSSCRQKSTTSTLRSAVPARPVLTQQGHLRGRESQV